MFERYLLFGLTRILFYSHSIENFTNGRKKLLDQILNEGSREGTCPQVRVDVFTRDRY